MEKRVALSNTGDGKKITGRVSNVEVIKLLISAKIKQQKNQSHVNICEWTSLSLIEDQKVTLCLK